MRIASVFLVVTCQSTGLPLISSRGGMILSGFLDVYGAKKLSPCIYSIPRGCVPLVEAVGVVVVGVVVVVAAVVAIVVAIAVVVLPC